MVKRVLYLFVFSVFAVHILGCKEASTKIIKTATITFTKEGELSIHKSATDAIVAQLDIEIAETDYETQTGLMHRDAMEEKQGMLFVFPDVAMHSFYMKNTLIPLDIIYIDQDLKIVSFQKNAIPGDETSLSSKVPIQYVLEINAGLTDTWGLAIGDSIRFSKTDSK